jgi:hypothetical protein
MFLWNVGLYLRDYMALSLTHEAEPFLRSRQLCSYSRITQYFMEPQSLLHVHKSPPLVPILSQINPIPSYLSKVHFNIVPSWYSQWSLSFWLSLHGVISQITELFLFFLMIWGKWTEST